MAIIGPKNEKRPAGLASTWQQPKAKFKPRKKQTYVVKRDDTYQRLAEKLFGDRDRVDDFIAANPDIPQPRTGQVITLPPKVRPAPAQVQAAPAQVTPPNQVQAPSWVTPDWQQRARERSQAPTPQPPPNPFASYQGGPVGVPGGLGTEARDRLRTQFNTLTKGPAAQPAAPAPQPIANQVTGRSVMPGYTARPIPGASNYQMPRPVLGGPTYTTTPTYIPAATPGEALPLQVQQSRSPTQLPDTWMNGLQRTATHTAAMLSAGQYPVTISGSDQYYLGLADDELIAAGYIKQPWGGWAIAYPKYPATDPGTGSGYGKRAAAPRGGGGGGGNRGGGGGGYGYGNYAPSQYSGTGRTYSDLTMGLVSWRI
jgi:hypothetical protein